jgi:hypothetical protein
LPKDVNRDTGLYADISVLFPCLNIGEICENFKRVGKIPEVNILLIIKINGDEINGKLSFTIHDFTSSYPNDFFHFKFFTYLIVLFSNHWLPNNWSEGLLKCIV